MLNSAFDLKCRYVRINVILNASGIFIQQCGRDILCVQKVRCVFSFALLLHSLIHWCGVSRRLLRI